MAWIYLFIAGLLEVVWAYTMKQSEGFTKLTPSAITIVAMIASFGLLAYAMRTLPLGTAYTIWTGIGVNRPGSTRHSRAAGSDVFRIPSGIPPRMYCGVVWGCRTSRCS